VCINRFKKKEGTGTVLAERKENVIHPCAFFEIQNVDNCLSTFIISQRLSLLEKQNKDSQA